MTNSRFNPALPFSVLDERELLDQLSLAERADWTLLALVSCAGIATLVLAAAISLVR